MIPGSTVKTLLQQCDNAFSQRRTLTTLWQEIADNFYVERADFTRHRYLGEEFADHLHSSYPLIVRRELGNSFSSMLRPMNLEWFETTIEDDRRLNVIARRWLEAAQHVQRRAMYDRRTGFVRATKEGDHDFAAFGQCVIEVLIDWAKPSLLYRTHHLRDCAWLEGYDGQIDTLFRKWKPTCSQLCDLYGDKVHQKLKEAKEKEPFRHVPCRVIVVKADKLSGGTSGRMPFVKIVVDYENQHVMEETPMRSLGHVIPRWQTVSGSQYAFSPATVAGLPDARLLQAISLTLMEAGEMAVRPPVVATQDVIRSDVNWFPGGITWADADYDERKGQVLQPISQDKSGLPFGIDMQQDIRSLLSSAFYLNKLSLPAPGQGGMSPEEVSHRINEYIREALPLFEPMEMEYNGGICEESFDLLLHAGAFGSMADIPAQLRGADIRFRFRSPLHDARERQKGATFMEAKELIRQAVELDHTTQHVVDARVALRDALHGIGVPADWERSRNEVDQAAEEMAARTDMAEQLALAQQAGEAGQAAGEGAQAVEQVAAQ